MMFDTRRLGSLLLAAALLAPVSLRADPAPAPDLPPKTKSALKLAGLVAFVANSCPNLKPDYTRFKQAVAALGVNVDDLSKGDMKGEYLGYAARYQTDVKGNCERANVQFGPKGATLPDIFGPPGSVTTHP